MTDVQLIEVIQQAIKNTLIDLGIEHKSKDVYNTFKKTEQILWTYPSFQQVIVDKLEQIDEVKEHGVRTKSRSILEYTEGGNQEQGLKLTEDAINDVVQDLQNDLQWLYKTLGKIDLALNVIVDDIHYPILQDYYFKGVTRNELASEWNVDVKTISRWKNRLVRKMAMYLFPKEAGTELLED